MAEEPGPPRHWPTREPDPVYGSYRPPHVAAPSGHPLSGHPTQPAAAPWLPWLAVLVVAVGAFIAGVSWDRTRDRQPEAGTDQVVSCVRAVLPGTVDDVARRLEDTSQCEQLTPGQRVAVAGALDVAYRPRGAGTGQEALEELQRELQERLQGLDADVREQLERSLEEQLDQLRERLGRSAP